MPDIFVSYARDDDEHSPDQSYGWVSLFIQNLKPALAQRLGRNGYDLFMDPQLPGNEPLTPELAKRIDHSETLLLFLSMRYLVSSWCQTELTRFCQKFPSETGRIFAVIMDDAPHQQRPQPLQDLPGYQLWYRNDKQQVRLLGYPVPTNEHKEYHEQVLNLADNLAAKLKTLRNGEPEPPTVLATVYVAPVIHSLVSARNQLISELQQFRIDCLPTNNRVSLDREMIKLEMQTCNHFVQLLDCNDAMGVPLEQCKIAQDLNIPVLQWRARELDCQVATEEQKALLTGPQVMACSLSEFKQYVREAVLPKQVKPVVMPARHTVFVYSGQQDMGLVEALEEKLTQKGFGVAKPRYAGTPAQIRESIERYLKLCQSMLMVQKETPAEVIESQLAELQINKSSLPMYVCRAPEAESLCFRPAGLRILPCGCELAEQCLEMFFSEVQP